MARFTVKQNGQPTEAWLPDLMEATDATGNEADFGNINYAATNGVWDGQGTSMNPSEVWRLRTSFTRHKDFAPEQMWASPDLPVRNGSLLPANLTTNFQSFQLSVEASGWTVRAKLSPKPKDAKLRLVEIVDNRGTKVEPTGGLFFYSEFDVQWKIPADAESIRIAIALAEMRHFEFFAQPVRQ
jgi:hypothetical protein